jgi:hypothetical protein
MARTIRADSIRARQQAPPTAAALTRPRAGSAMVPSGVTLRSGTRLHDLEEPGAVPLPSGSAVDV